MVFDQRDKVTDNSSSNSQESESVVEVLKDIRESMKRIEAKFNS